MRVSKQQEVAQIQWKVREYGTQDIIIRLKKRVSVKRPANGRQDRHGNSAVQVIVIEAEYNRGNRDWEKRISDQLMEFSLRIQTENDFLAKADAK